MPQYPIFAFCPQCQRRYGLEMTVCAHCRARGPTGGSKGEALFISEPIGKSGEFRKIHPPGSLSKAAVASMRKRNGNDRPWEPHPVDRERETHKWNPDDDAA